MPATLSAVLTGLDVATPKVTELAPLPAWDEYGTVAMYVMLAWCIGGYMVAMFIGIMGGPAPAPHPHDGHRGRRPGHLAHHEHARRPGARCHPRPLDPAGAHRLGLDRGDRPGGERSELLRRPLHRRPGDDLLRLPVHAVVRAAPTRSGSCPSRSRGSTTSWSARAWST
ncbi:hypothetical protein Q9Q99_19205 [Curtobacterium flaccumfaciens]|nr:hypothetical protein Q9Q99_19205 [Curtobacterium flaccumfaciens]